VIIILIKWRGDVEDILELGKADVKGCATSETSHHGMREKANNLGIVKEGGREGGRGEIYE
jgi:hypothetical protein